MALQIQIPKKVFDDGSFYQSDLITTKLVLSKKVKRIPLVVEYHYVVDIPTTMRHKSVSGLFGSLSAAFYGETRGTVTYVRKVRRISRSKAAVMVKTISTY